LQKIEVVEGFDCFDVFGGEAKGFQLFFGSGMDGVNDWKAEFFVKVFEAFEDLGEPFLVVHVLLTVDSD